MNIDRRSLLVGGLSAATIALLVAIFYSPIWWVALTAPNYPKEAFPDGVRIHFHINGVFNGCKKVEKTEIQEEQALDCVHEMDTINHYVGMYPIAAGGPIERAFGQFLIAFLIVMVLGFAITSPRIRTWVMAVGFAGIFAWMYATLYTDGGLYLQNEGYLEGMVSALDQDAQDQSKEEEYSSGNAILERLRQSLAESGIEVKVPSETVAEEEGDGSAKDRYIENMRITYEKDHERRGLPMDWNASGFQTMAWHYEKTLGRYFNNPAEINPMVDTLKTWIHVIFAALAGAMVLLVVMARKTGSLFYWLLALVPVALPVLFIIDYAAWLWWFGHNLNEMGAFTVKPFMPTVFGQGKVAQFATHSYPYIGFGLMVLVAACMGVAAWIRRNQLHES
jgi:hypothetical protein